MTAEVSVVAMLQWYCPKLCSLFTALRVSPNNMEHNGFEFE